uniref:Integrin beta n=1 Tax=Xiphophorus couchianus TaxID=32473 RepID=A0A3B5MYJ6_9TELE
LQRGPQCAWCFQEVGMCTQVCVCVLLSCPHGKSASPSGQVHKLKLGILCSEASFVVAVKQLERYPVDLYYLVDVSASMQENLDHVGLADLGVALSLRMTQHTSDLWLGFGSFVDKPVSPFMSVHPSKIDNPCRYRGECVISHGFHHVLSMTGNISEFTRVMKRQRISANVDTPEGGLDAMLQAAVCQRAVGWRPEAKRLLLLMTDQPSHLALDSKLAGIVTPHDGRCHLDNNVYTGSTKMDHPSLGLLSDKLLENHIYPIFAVEKMQYQWYEELVKLLPGAILGKLGLFQAPNLIDLVVDAYKVKSSTCGFSLKIPFFFHSSKEDASAIEKRPELLRGAARPDGKHKKTSHYCVIKERNSKKRHPESAGDISDYFGTYKHITESFTRQKRFGK